ncbi:sugar-transfer associated ATP-grasp domain-containing protein [Lysobacter tyrosinilyticus]
MEALAFRLFEAGAGETSRWLYFWEFICLSRQLTDTPARELADDKVAFADWCRANGFRAIPTYALAAHGEWQRPFPDGEPPREDLLVKPTRGSQGTGVESWRWRDTAFCSGTTRLNPQEFMSHVRTLGATGNAVMVQPLLAPHDALHAIAGEGMPALRIFTSRWPDNRVEVGPAMLQAPCPGMVISQSGPYRLVDTDSGRVMDATARQMDPVFEMPVGHGFDGIVLPQWPGVIAVLKSAHTCYPGLAPVIGWDVLFDREGPLLCEANLGVSFYSFQFASPIPLGTSTIGKALEAWQ